MLGQATLGAAIFERDHELDALSNDLAAAAEGTGRLMLVEGEAGIGKSVLLQAARDRADAAGFTVLSARGSELESEFALGAVLQLFGPTVAALPGPERDRIFEGAAVLVRDVIEGGFATAPSGASLFPMLHGLYWLTANLAERTPLAIVVDDVHWLDEPSLRFLLHLGKRLAGLHVALLAATRHGSGATHVPALLAAEPDCAVLRPQLLSAAAVSEIVSAWRPDADPVFVDACHAATGGNPLLVRHLITALDEEGVPAAASAVARVHEVGPRPVSRAAELVLRRLPPAATDLARATAILGDGTRLDYVARLARMPVEEAGHLAAALATASVFAAAPQPAFVHPIVRAALYEELQPAERAVAHAAAAELLAEGNEPVELVAGHLLHAPPAGDQASVETLRAAARDASNVGAPASAITYLTRALEEPPTGESLAEVLLELGRAEAASGVDEAFRHLHEGLEASSRPRVRAEAARDLGRVLHTSGRFTEAVAMYDVAIGELAESAPNLLAELEAGWATAALWVPEISSSEMMSRVTAVLEDAGGAGPARRDLLANMAGIEAMRGEDRARTTALGRAAWDDGAMLREGSVDNAALWSVTGALYYTDAWAEAVAVTESVMEAARERGSIMAYATASYVRGSAELIFGGRISRVMADTDAALDARAEGWEAFLPAALWTRAHCLLESGDVAGAAEAATMSPELEEKWTGSPVHTLLLDARGHVALAQGDPSSAWAHFRKMRENWDAIGMRNPGFFAYNAGAAVAAARQGDLAEARRLCEEELALARKWGASRPVGTSLLCRGTIERPRDGIDWLRGAVEELDGSGADLTHARALTSLGTALRIANHRAEAREPLRAGLEKSRACGARMTAERAQAELLQAGGRPRRERTSGVRALTPSERRVADLAAAGNSNRQIAESLFVTKKAVEYHLGNVYGKLGVKGRDSLATALGGSGYAGSQTLG